jgi:anti-sigma factor RsiW
MHPTQADINDYVDGALSLSDRAAVAEHVDQCATCRTLADDLRELRRAARDLAPIEPPARLWTKLEQAVRESSTDRRQPAVTPFRGLTSRTWRSQSVWVAAAAAVLVLAAGLSIRMGFFASRESTPVEETEAPTAQSVEAELRQAEEHYQKAISGLEQIAKTEKGELDPRTADTLQANLAVVDQAISESRAALRTQPNSEPAQQSLLASFKAKIGLLQETVALINEMRKGNEAGAARIVSGLQQQ